MFRFLRSGISVQRRCMCDAYGLEKDSSWLNCFRPSALTGTKSKEIERLRDSDLSDLERLERETLTENSWIYLADYFSWHGHESGLSLVKNRMNCGYPDGFIREAEFRHFYAQLFWVKRHVEKGADELDAVYSDNKRLREWVVFLAGRLILKTCTSDGLANLNLVRNFAVRFAQNHDTWSVVGAVWLALFTSPWHAEQQQSVQLLETYGQLRHHLRSFIPRFGEQLLSRNAVVDYQRLIQDTLKFNDMSDATEALVRGLFDYYYNAGYKRGCTAIYECAHHIDIKLTPFQHHKYCLMANVKISPEKKILHIAVPQLPYKF